MTKVGRDMTKGEVVGEDYLTVCDRACLETELWGWRPDAGFEITHLSQAHVETPL